jgi:hypothetical protein
MRGLALTSMIGLGACTAINPAYQATDVGESGPTGDDVAGSTAAETAATSSDSESSGGEPLCELHPPQPLRISVSSDGQPIEPPCGGDAPTRWFESGNSIFEGNTIIHPVCLPEDQTCLCGGVDVEITLEGLDEFPAGVPSCGRIALWSMEGPMGGCEWGGLMMQNDIGLAPVFIASRTRTVPPLGPMFMLGLEPEDEASLCMGECDPDPPGRYALDVLGERVAADGLSHFVEISFLDGAPLRYDFENRMSSITRECEEQVVWLAVLDP